MRHLAHSRSQMEIKLTNTAKRVQRGGNRDWWDWVAYLEVPSEQVLESIEYVEYYLHPSYPNPTRRVTKREGGFPLSCTGWGTFELKAKVVFKSNELDPIILSRYIQFDGAL